MWSQIVGLALFTSLNPLLLGFILLVISRPRPVQNLLAFWIGSLIVNVPLFLISLMVLHVVPSFESLAKDLATPDPTSGIQPLQLGTGVFALCVAVLMAMHRRARKRAPQPAAGGGDSSVLVLDSDESTAVSNRPEHRRGALARALAVIRRLWGRLHDEWENGALWVALVFGMAYLPPPPLLLLVVTIIGGSGALVGVQVVAVVAFVLMMLAVFEVVLLCYVIAPVRTRKVLEPVHDWALVHRTQVLIALFFLVGIWQVLTGLGIV